MVKAVSQITAETDRSQVPPGERTWLKSWTRVKYTSLEEERVWFFTSKHNYDTLILTLF